MKKPTLKKTLLYSSVFFFILFTLSIVSGFVIYKYSHTPKQKKKILSWTKAILKKKANINLSYDSADFDLLNGVNFKNLKIQYLEKNLPVFFKAKKIE